MMYLVLKAAITGTVIVAVSEIAKRSSLLAAILASLPLASIVALIFLYTDTKDVVAVRGLSTGIFWMVLPSLFFFWVFPHLLKLGIPFYVSVAAASLGMFVVYWVYLRALQQFGIFV